MSVVSDFLMQSVYFHNGLRTFYTELVERFIGLDLADKHYVKSLIDADEHSFWERIWEAILGCHLSDLGFKPRSEDEGPDFLCDVEGKRVWFEAICPRPKGLPEEWLKRDGVYAFPADALALNWTAALKEKRDKLEGANGRPGYLEKKIVGHDDGYVIAVNSSRLGGGSLAEFGISQYPFSAEVGFGIGPIAVSVDSDGNFGEAHHTTRFKVIKPNSSTVGSAVFFDDAYAGVSAVLSTGYLCPQPKSFPFTLVHNPTPRSALPTGRMGDVVEYASHLEGDTVTLTRL